MRPAPRLLPPLIGMDRQQRPSEVVVDTATLGFESADRRRDLGAQQGDDSERVGHGGS